jgi:hypothetical protein
MGAIKRWQMEQMEREYDEKLHEANERDDDVGYKEPRDDVGYKEPRDVADKNTLEEDK